MVLALNRLGRARRQAALYNSRRRRLSLLSDARLFSHMNLPEGDTLNLSVVFSEQITPICFEGVMRFTGGPPGGPARLLDTGNPGIRIIPRNNDLQIVGNAGQFFVNVPLGKPRTLRWNLAIRPGDAQVRFWVDSQLRVAAKFGNAPFAWHSDGTLTYQTTNRATALSPMRIYYKQRPRHFGGAQIELAGPVGEQILFRAAIATFLTGAFPFQDNPTDTP